ncbi:DUF2509 family protein [Chimaeribacter arupi]|uniref:DUF2509 family protein n=1 Tax=Chimaeribacter arupi TaxID=2060066 RepID=UPI002712010C|nr:DUF2509 family protein [Chimaeribacter arupi]WKZ93128.1 DUF2509 family protein [Chimaeribacter arupi]
MRRQQGNALLLTLMGLMLLGLMGMTALHRQLDEAVRLTAGTRQHVLAWHQAASSLTWAETLNWPPANSTWQCRAFHPGSLHGCIKAASAPGVILLRGEGQRADDSPLFLYRLAAPGKGGRLTVQAGGWLDFCPEKAPHDCDGEAVP